MNCFMGYNPLVAKEVKITTWIKEFDGDSPVYPSFPNEGDCFVVFATDEDALTHNALSKKTYTNGEWADAEGGSTPTGTIKITENGEGIDVSEYAYADVNVSGGGGGFDIPTFTKSYGEYSCDMTYEEAKASYVATTDSVGRGLVYTPVNHDGKAWGYDVLASGELLSYFDIPETVNEGLALMGDDGSPVTLYADDGNFYGLNQ